MSNDNDHEYGVPPYKAKDWYVSLINKLKILVDETSDRDLEMLAFACVTRQALGRITIVGECRERLLDQPTMIPAPACSVTRSCTLDQHQ